MQAEGNAQRSAGISGLVRVTLHLILWLDALQVGNEPEMELLEVLEGTAD